MIKTISELKKLNTKRLLAYYKVRRQETFSTRFVCDCGCGEHYWDLIPSKYVKEKEEYDMLSAHVKEIKELLNTKEHVE